MVGGAGGFGFVAASTLPINFSPKLARRPNATKIMNIAQNSFEPRNWEMMVKIASGET